MSSVVISVTQANCFSCSQTLYFNRLDSDTDVLLGMVKINRCRGYQILFLRQKVK